jgi:hypothetical protein
MKNASDGALYLHCEECEWGWRDPDAISDPSRGFLTVTEAWDALPATMAEIHGGGWDRYVTGTIEK